MQEGKNKNRLVNVIIWIVFLIGMGILAYPTISDAWNRYRNAKLITDYSEGVKKLSTEEYDILFQNAHAYNENMASFPYDSLLNPLGDGVMGYLKIPKINVNLAIYHGVGETVLERGCGHIKGTSLPVGGEGTHAVLAAHRGLPSAKLFTDLDKMKIGDRFYITILHEKLIYEVDQIKTVLPTEAEAIAIENGKDYVTLLTCTPYGVNTHRLLVRGTRVH